MSQDPLTLAIIGGGFTGSLIFCHLVEQVPKGTQVLLFDQASGFGRGIAYGGADPNHILNVRARQMSAFPTKPGHFTSWLQAHEALWRNHHAAYAEMSWNENSFMPRMIYGLYIEHCLEDALKKAVSRGIKVSLLPEKVLALEPSSRGLVVKSSMLRRHADAVIIATGNSQRTLIPGEAPGRILTPEVLIRHRAALREARDIVILGTGLSMIDALVTLDKMAVPAQVTAISRHGLLPMTHEPPGIEEWPYPAQDWPYRAAALSRKIRTDVTHAMRKGKATMPILAKIRADSNGLWRYLTPEARRHLRRVMPYWGRFRHRMPEQAAALIDGFSGKGQLRILADRAEAIDHADGRLLVQGRKDYYPADIVVNALGFNYAHHHNPLLKQLAEAKMIEVAEGAPVPSKAARVSRAYPIYAAGPLMSGALFETVAVPELRVMASDLASQVIEEVAAPSISSMA